MRRTHPPSKHVAEFLTHNTSCLACHGLKDRRPQFVKDGYPQDLAYNFHVGDLRGMYAVFIPDDIQKAIEKAVNE